MCLQFIVIYFPLSNKDEFYSPSHSNQCGGKKKTFRMILTTSQVHCIQLALNEWYVTINCLLSHHFNTGISEQNLQQEIGSKQWPWEMVVIFLQLLFWSKPQTIFLCLTKNFLQDSGTTNQVWRSANDVWWPMAKVKAYNPDLTYFANLLVPCNLYCELPCSASLVMSDSLTL